MSETENSGTDQPWCESVCEGGHYMCELEGDHNGPHRVRYRDKEDYVWTDDDPVAQPASEYQWSDDTETNQ